MEQTQENDIVVIGCGAGGATAAQFAKKNDRKAQVTIFESGSYAQYSKCGIPYTISGEIPKIMNLLEFTEEWFKKAKINLHLHTKVESIDCKKKIITAEKKDGSIIKKQYSSLIIATGAQPTLPPIKHIVDENANKLKKNIFTVRTIDDAKEISKTLESAKNATVVGAGLIGLEMADTLHKKGLKVTLVEALPTILTNILDEDMSKSVLKKIEEEITVYLNTFATEITTDSQGNLKSVLINEKEKNGTKEIPTDILIIAAGIKPEISLAGSIDCKIGVTGSIKVNDRSQTSIDDIYAVGDCTEYVDFVTGKPVPIGLGSIAVRQGIAAGINATGGNYQLPEGVLQTATSDFFNIEIGSVGPCTKLREDMQIVTAKHNGYSKPEYFPGGKPITMKIIVDLKTGIIIGAQAVGENAAQRVNTYATAILSKLNIDTFKKLETAYAPPIAPTLDVVTLVADVASLKWHRSK